MILSLPVNRPLKALGMALPNNGLKQSTITRPFMDGPIVPPAPIHWSIVASLKG